MKSLRPSTTGVRQFSNNAPIENTPQQPLRLVFVPSNEALHPILKENEFEGIEVKKIPFPYSFGNMTVGSRSYLPVGYIVNEPICGSQGGSFGTNYGSGNFGPSTNGDNGYCIITYQK